MKIMNSMIMPSNFFSFFLVLACFSLLVPLTSENVLAAKSKAPTVKPADADSNYHLESKRPAVSPADAVSKYIYSYQGDNFRPMNMLDARMSLNLSNAMSRAPEPYKQEEREKVELENLQYVRAHEKNKTENGFYLENSTMLMSGSGSIPFFLVLSTYMKYKILEVRDKTVNGPFDLRDDFNKEALVELSYTNPDKAPRDESGKIVKKAVVRVKIMKWSKWYKILGYDVTKFGREYF